METSLNHLPSYKQGELKKIVSLIRKVEKRIEMVILYGSHTRDDWVDRDNYVKDGIRYEYRSDFDLLLVVPDEEMAGDSTLRSLIKERIRDETNIQTPVSLIAEDIEFLNDKLAYGHYFFTDIKKQGIVLYDSGKYRLAKPKKLSPEKKRQLLLDDYEMWSQKAKDFLMSYETLFQQGEKSYNTGAFHLHQASESLYTLFLLVFTGYKPKTHKLDELGEDAGKVDKRFRHIFSRATRRNEDLFDLLDGAYTDARYEKDYEVSKAELKMLANRIRKFQQRVEQACKERIREMAKKIK